MIPRDLRAALAIFALAASLFLLVGNWVPEEGDSEVAFQAARAMARGRLSLEPDTPSARAILARTAADGDAYNCRLGADGKQYPYWGVAYVLGGVPAYALGAIADGAAHDVNARFATQTFTADLIPGSQYFARAAFLALGALAGAGALALVYLAARRLGVSPGAAATAALLTGFATSLGVQARSGLSDIHATFLVALALERALAARGGGRTRDLVTAGAAFGLAIACKVSAATALPGLALLAVAAPWTRGRLASMGRAAGLVALGAAPIVGLMLLANFARWGSPFITGYEKSTARPEFWVPIQDGMWRLLAAPSKGLVEFALPIVVLGLFGWARLARRGDALAAAALALSAIGALLLPASTYEWHGAWAFGPRYALLAFPALAVGAAVAIDAFRGRARFAVWALGAASFLVIAPGFVTSPFGAGANAMAGARVIWPDESFPPAYGEADRGTERFQRICLETGPLNLLRVQHRLLWAALEGRDRLRYRDDLGIDRDGDVETPPAIEHRGFGGIGWVGFRTRFGGDGAFLVPALLASLATVAATALWRALHEPARGARR